ncbi:MAG: rod shape-determining protein MreD [Candidatus Marinimicrobia bacterium]|jgi:rod shape-determining protein MreD|nr:rod shape-determining protein MreD [Candidatus Neomarinimicrobiota bacterium]MBT3502331.1 rod shape-determining protein MreD [Candidatus Neomarinimicrobiota bacterium]MBT3999452.1 rod shape-determining protein MreD [Candidatus Neomarinimicrobiota bacterium]MBT4282045.1 rod shape-determining protein MreD [Candidatus Neomarinimicrobiota bacterium]MBT4578568.1 rod shape-determining protein MreD [Candidatus Neomarinimicrobiota bacterium]
MMKWSNFFITGIFVWLIQLLLADFLAIQTIRPDFIAILVLYWSIRYGGAFGTVAGFLIGLLIDLSGSVSFFGLSPMIYSMTGYLGGFLMGQYSKLNPFYFSISWILILSLQFFIFCVVQYQEIWAINPQQFFGQWVGTTLYTLCFAGIFQFIYPIHKIA